MHLTKVSNPAGSTHRDYATFKVSVSKNIYSSLRDRSFITSGGGGRVQFFKRLDFRGRGSILKMHKMSGGGVDILRPRTGLLCKSYYCYYSYSAHCQTIL